MENIIQAYKRNINKINEELFRLYEMYCSLLKGKFRKLKRKKK